MGNRVWVGDGNAHWKEMLKGPVIHIGFVQRWKHFKEKRF